MSKNNIQSRSSKEKDSEHQDRLPGFVTHEEVGLGDAVKRVTTWIGIKPCGGCNRRAETLNRWMVFTR